MRYYQNYPKEKLAFHLSPRSIQHARPSHKGGGSFSPGTMVKEFDEVVFSPDTVAGEINGPIKTQFGYHLLVVDKRTGGGDWY